MAGDKRQERAAATRRLLIDAARTVFSERGYQGASVAAITEQAQTAHGTFYLYFRNKEDAFAEVMTDLVDGLYQHSFTPLDDMGAGFDLQRNRERTAAFLTHFVAHGPLWRALLEGVLASPVIEARWLELRGRFHQGVAERLRLYQEAGQLQDLDVDTVAYALCAMLEWFSFTGVAFSSPRPLVADDATIDLLSDLWVHALGLRPPPGSDPA